MSDQREGYGIDAPGVVRGLAGFGALALGIAAGVALLIDRSTLPATRLTRDLRDNLVVVGLVLLAVMLWMTVSSLWLKRRVLTRLLDMRDWRGDEVALDIGCGRGLVAIAMARRLPTGRVAAIDLWHARDLSGNNPMAMRANAIAAGVADRITVDTADMRVLPYAPGSFDVVASMTAIHNIEDAKGRETAIAEAWRVLKPGGQMLIYDIRHAPAYARQLGTLGAELVTLSRPIFLWGLIGYRLSATKPRT